jgi:hypothetical protein
MDWYRDGCPDFDISQEQETFIYSKVCRLALGPILLAVRAEPQAPCQKYFGRGVKLTTHLHTVSKSKIVELYLESPPQLH